MDSVFAFLGPEIAEAATRTIKAVVGFGVRISPIYIVTMIIIAFVLFRVRKIEGSFLGWLVPRNIYFHKSHMTDIKLFALGRIISILRILPSAGIQSAVATAVLLALGARLGHSASVWGPVAATFAVLIVNDFCTYWIHRTHHQTAALWPFHEVHHSAEVMTPITVYRKHPVYDLFGSIFRSAMLGMMFGFWLWVFADKVSIVHVAGASVLYIAFHAAGSNFRHSHIWISYGPFWERIFVSPAQHQIHHSIDLQHRDKNFGEVFAVWDWMFGTLYRPARVESLTFGLSDETGASIPQPHTGLRTAIIRPFQDSWRALRGKSAPAP